MEESEGESAGEGEPTGTLSGESAGGGEPTGETTGGGEPTGVLFAVAAEAVGALAAAFV